MAFVIGDCVRHPTMHKQWGVGRVVAVSSDGKVTVKFSLAGRKILKGVPLQKVSGDEALQAPARDRSSRRRPRMRGTNLNELSDQKRGSDKMRLPRSYLSYWKPSTADPRLEDAMTVGHSASEQYARLEAEDTVWIVTARRGRLKLLGRIEVDLVCDQRTAATILGVDEDDLWEATYHIIAKPGTEVTLQEIAIDDLAGNLRFETTPDKDRLTIVGSRIDPRQLQAMRRLTEESARLLAERFAAATEAVNTGVERSRKTR